MHFTLKQHPMTYEDLEGFIQCYHPENRYEGVEPGQQIIQMAGGANILLKIY